MLLRLFRRFKGANPFRPLCRGASTAAPNTGVEKSLTSAQEQCLSLNEGQNLLGGDFTVVKKLQIPSINLMAVQLRNNVVGASHIHLSAADSNSAFSVSFKTPPTNSTGVSHILEHLVLCGSKNYPVKDPFFKMLSRSVATFVNAMTYYDHTTFPFSSANVSDFNNLLDVYLDAVFNPLLLKEYFDQEAWRIEKNDATNSFKYDGVVFNEMKGVLNSQSTIHEFEFFKNLLPSSFNFNYGGDPHDIVSLKYESLLDFYKSFYSFDNCLFLTYGDRNLQDYLEPINAFFKKNNFQPSKNLKKIVVPKESVVFEGVKRVHALVPPLADAESNHNISVGFALDHKNTTKEDYFGTRLSMGILSNLLLFGPNAPFYNSIFLSNLGKDYCPVTGYHSSSRTSNFCVGLLNVEGDKLDRVENLINEQLQNVSSKDIEENQLLALLKETELSLKHVSTNAGINKVTSIPTIWSHDQDVFEFLNVDAQLEQVKNIIDSDYRSFIDDNLNKHIKTNSHKLIFTTENDKNFYEKLNKREEEILFAAPKTDIFDPQLKNHQQQHNNIECLPMLKLEDFTDKPFKNVYQQESAYMNNGISANFSLQPTNNIVYLYLHINTHNLPHLLKPYLPLFCEIFCQVGGGDSDHKQMDTRQKLYTSGLSMSLCSSSDLNNAQTVYDEGLLLSSYCFPGENFNQLTGILTDLFVKPHIYNDNYVHTLINEFVSNKIVNFSESVSGYGSVRSASGFSKLTHLNEVMFGLTGLDFVKNTLNTEDKADIVDKLNQLCAVILDPDNFRVLLIGENNEIINQSINSLNGNFLENLTESSSNDCYNNNDTEQQKFKLNCVNEFYMAQLRGNYCSRSISGTNFTNYKEYAGLSILTEVITLKHLFPNIREKNGAYGARLSNSNGLLSFMSYRDPKIKETLKTFDECNDFVQSSDFTEQAFSEAQIKIIGKLDNPIAPSKRTLSMFTNGMDNGMVEKYRQALIDVDHGYLRELSGKYFGNGGEYDFSVVFGENEADIQELNESGGKKWKIEKKFYKLE